MRKKRNTTQNLKVSKHNTIVNTSNKTPAIIIMVQNIMVFLEKHTCLRQCVLMMSIRWYYI